jgi:hypothetical protein
MTRAVRIDLRQGLRYRCVFVVESDQVPQVGATVEFEGGEWIVARVEETTILLRVQRPNADTP